MKYDEEYNSFKFNPKDIEMLLSSLSYAHRNDNSLSQPDKDRIDGLYWLFHNSGRFELAN